MMPHHRKVSRDLYDERLISTDAQSFEISNAVNIHLFLRIHLFVVGIHLGFELMVQTVT